MICVSIFILLALSFYQFVVDDVYISLRYARNPRMATALDLAPRARDPLKDILIFLWVLMECSFILDETQRRKNTGCQ